MAWIYLFAAGVFEVGFTTTLRFAQGLKHPLATVAFLICVLFSLFFLETAAKSIPLGTAYAIWTGIGAVGTVAIGMIWFSEPATIIRGLMILGVIACVVGLKLTSSH